MLITMLDSHMHFRSWDGSYLDDREERAWRGSRHAIKRKLAELKCPYEYEEVGEWMLAHRSKKNQAITAWMQENGKK